MSEISLPGVALTPNYSRITLKETKFLRDLKLYYEHKTWDEEHDRFEHHYSLYTFRRGQGRTLDYIFTRSKRRITEPWLRLTPLSRDEIYGERGSIKILLPESKIIMQIAGEHGVELDKDATDVDYWAAILQRHVSNAHEPFLWKIQPPLTEDEINRIKRWDFEQLEHDYFYEGLNKSEIIVDAYRSGVITFHTNPYAKEETPQKIQPYNDHMTLISPTKMSKTWLGDKIGIHYDEATKAGLKGFSTADATNIGVLDGTYKLVTCDNVHEYPTESLRGLLEIREKGSATISKGKAPVHTRTTSAINFILNPPDTTDPSQLAQFFVEYIRKQAEVSTGPVASRDSLVVFLTAIEEVTGDPLEDTTVKKNKLVFEHILDVVNQRVETDIFRHRDVQSWLNRNIDNFYGTINRFFEGRDAVVVTEEIRNYWRSLGKAAFKHIRGRALKQGIMDNLKPIYLNEYDLTQILSDAEEQLHRICHLIIESMQRMLTLISQVPRDQWILNRYQQIPNKYVKAVVLAVAIYAKNHDVERLQRIPFYNVREDYNNLPNALKPEYCTHYGNIEHSLPKSLTKFNRKIRDFGIAFTKEGAQSVYFILFTKSPRDLHTLIDKLTERRG